MVTLSEEVLRDSHVGRSISARASKSFVCNNVTFKPLILNDVTAVVDSKQVTCDFCNKTHVSGHLACHKLVQPDGHKGLFRKPKKSLDKYRGLCYIVFMIKQAWVKTWESFAGKPYVKPAGKPKETIKETVRRAQDLLCEQIKTHTYKRELKFVIYETDNGQRTVRVEPDSFQYPQSLGELCLEQYENKIKNIKKAPGITATERNGFIWFTPLDKIKIDMLDLRRAMWHKDRGCYSVDKVGKVWVTWESGEYVRSREKGYELI